MDDLILAAQAAERGEQPAILFSHVDGGQTVPTQQYATEKPQLVKPDTLNPSLGTMNQSPVLIVKPKLA